MRCLVRVEHLHRCTTKPQAPQAVQTVRALWRVWPMAVCVCVEQPSSLGKQVDACVGRSPNPRTGRASLAGGARGARAPFSVRCVRKGTSTLWPWRCRYDANAAGTMHAAPSPGARGGAQRPRSAMSPAPGNATCRAAKDWPAAATWERDAHGPWGPRSEQAHAAPKRAGGRSPSLRPAGPVLCQASWCSHVALTWRSMCSQKRLPCADARNMGSAPKPREREREHCVWTKQAWALAWQTDAVLGSKNLCWCSLGRLLPHLAVSWTRRAHPPGKSPTQAAPLGKGATRSPMLRTHSTSTSR